MGRTKTENLVEEFWSGNSLEERVEAAKALAQWEPDEAWELFLKGSRTSHLSEAVQGFCELGDNRAVPILHRIFYERGGSQEELEVLIQGLFSLRGVDALCSIAEDPFVPPLMHLIVLESLRSFASSRAVKLFLTELEASCLTRQRLAVTTLGEWRIAEAVGPLNHRLRDHHASSLRQPILRALAQIGTHDALVGLQEQLLHPQKNLRVEAAEELALCLNPTFLPLLHACHASFRSTEPEAAKLAAVILQLEQALEAQFQVYIQPHRSELEDALFSE